VANHQIIFKMYYLLLWVKPITTIYETLETSQFPQEGLVYIKVLLSQVSLDSGTICQQTWEILLSNKCLKTKYEKFMTCLTNHHYIFLLVLELLIYYMLAYVKNVVASNAIYLYVI
jgi:hypothetical protein